MYYDVVNVKYIEGYKLKITFENGRTGVVDLQEYAKMKGVFKRFLDIEYFKRAYVNDELGILCWPDGVDIAPETLYSKATGEPLPAWMSQASDIQHKEMAA